MPVTVGDLAADLEATTGVGVWAEVGPVGIMSTLVIEGVYFQFHVRAVWGVLANDGALRVRGMNPV